MKKNTLLSIGECMIELTDTGPGLLRQSFAGDTFNTAYYARHSLPENWHVEYFTALGNDTASEEMITFMATHHVGTQHVMRVSDRVPGIYRVHVENGERSFSYWRSNSAAKRLASNRSLLSEAITSCDVIFFSGITMAIIDVNDRTTLLEELARAKESRIVVFDPNIRPRLWENNDQMKSTITEAALCATIVMPSFDDEAMCFSDLSPDATIERYQKLGVDHIVLKNGAAGAQIYFNGSNTYIPAVETKSVIDTTSAGDSFNGSYLGQFLQGKSPREAALTAARVASFVIGKHGAIIPLCPAKLF